MAVESQRQCNCLDLYRELKNDIVELLCRLLISADSSETIASLVGSLRQSLRLDVDLEIADSLLAQRDVPDDSPGAKYALLRAALRKIIVDCTGIDIGFVGDMELTTAIEDYIVGGGYVPVLEPDGDER